MKKQRPLPRKQPLLETPAADSLSPGVDTLSPLNPYPPGGLPCQRDDERENTEISRDPRRAREGERRHGVTSGEEEGEEGAPSESHQGNLIKKRQRRGGLEECTLYFACFRGRMSRARCIHPVNKGMSCRFLIRRWRGEKVPPDGVDLIASSTSRVSVCAARSSFCLCIMEDFIRYHVAAMVLLPCLPVLRSALVRPVRL